MRKLLFLHWIALPAALLSLVHADESEPKTFQNSPVVADGAKLTLLADGFKFTEGPATDQYGNVYFTDQPNDRIHKWSTDGKLSLFLEPAGRSNGLYFDVKGSNGLYFGTKGRLLACADERNELWSIDVATTEVTVLLKDFEGKRFNGPNDVWMHPSGGLYFTDPFYKRDYWKHSEPELPGQHVYYLAPDGKTVRPVVTDLLQPNGIIGTADGKTLFVADIRDNKTYRYAIGADGSLSEKTLAADLGSDGMTLDTEGNLYLTGKGVIVFDKEAKQIERVPVPEGWTANLTFGGVDRRLLFITAMDSVYGLKMKTKGQ